MKATVGHLFSQGQSRPLSALARPFTLTFMRYIALIPVMALAACESPSLQGLLTPAAAPVEVVAPVETPEALPETLDPTPPPPPPPSARTVEQFDTTTAEDRAEALAVDPEPAPSAALGTTIASLGSPSDPGIWLKTPLVTTLTPGRVEYQGNSVNVELRPSGGVAGSGSQMSLAAMRLIEAPLTGLPEVSVFTR